MNKIMIGILLLIGTMAVSCVTITLETPPPNAVGRFWEQHL